MLFFFIIDVFNRYFIQTANAVARINDRVQILKNEFFSSDSLHDFNTFSSFTQSRKRVFDDITINANNRSVKRNREKSFETKNKFHASRKSRVESHVIFYLFTFSLFFYIISRRRRRESSLFSFSFTFIFFSSFLSHDSFRRSSFSFFRFRIKKKRKKIS